MFESSDKQHDDGTDARAFGLGLIVGAMVGASAALLLAPASGEQTRRRLRKGAQRLYTQSGELVGDLWDDADRSTRSLRKSASKGLKRGMKRSRRYVDDAADLVESGRRRFSWR